LRPVEQPPWALAGHAALLLGGVVDPFDERVVQTVRADRIRKSVGAENTFPVDLFTYEAARDELREIGDKVWGYCERAGIRGRTVTLKVKYANFQIVTRSL